VFLDFCPKKILLFNLFVFLPDDFTIFFKIRENPSLKSTFYRSRWASKTLAISDFYKRCTPWLELKVYCADLKFFVITPRWDTKLLHVKINFIYIYIYIYIYITTLYFCHAFYFHYFPGSYAQKSLFSFVHKVYKACDNV